MTKIQLKRSSALLSGSARVPAANQLDYGELAVNYSTTDPQLFYKDSGGSVVSFFEPYAALAGATFTGDVNFNTDVDFDGAVTIKGDSTNGSGKLTLTCENNTHSVNIKAPAHSAAANYTLTLPTTTGTSGNVLTTDGSGGLSWALSSMSNADAAKLAGIEAGATADQTGAEIKTLYEAETNAFTDALFTKLSGVETGATADQTAAEILAALLTVDGSGSGLDADLLRGLQPSTGPVANNVMLRDGNAYARAVYFYAGSTDTNNDGWYKARTINDSATTPDGVVVMKSGWYYHQSKSDFQTWIEAGLLADEAKVLKSQGSYNISASSLPTSYPTGQQIDFVRGTEGWFDYGTVITTKTYSGGGATLQMYVPYSSTYGGISLKYRMGDYNTNSGNSWTSWRTIWDSNNDGAGSGLDADLLDGYDWNSNNKHVYGLQIIASDWFRNDAAGEGLYNNVTGKHFFSAGTNYWHLDSTNGLILYDAYNASPGHATNRKGYLYRDSNGFGLLNSNGNWIVNSPHNSSFPNILVVGGHEGNNHYNTIATTRMSFGGGNDFANYHFGTNSENFSGLYTKLDLRWHTGIRIGAQSSYGGIRIYNNEDLSSNLVQFNSHPSGHTKHHQWIEFSGTYGLYHPTNSAHFHPNSSTTATHSPWVLTGNKNSFTGIALTYGGQKISIGMFDTGGNGGTYNEVGNKWYTYYSNGNSCLGVSGSTTSSAYALYVTGAIYATDNIVAYSDARKKTNITTITSALSKILNLRGVTYNKIQNDKSVNEKTEIGLIAQEVEKVVPEVVTYAEDIDQYGVSYGNLTALLIEAVKELKIELNELKESLA